MCMDYSTRCTCGKREASFHFRDNVMPPEAVSRLYCPECSGDLKMNPESMIADNGWVIEFDMDIANFSAHKLPSNISARLTPGVLFDEGYVTWRGVYPGDHIDSAREREALARLAKEDPRGYLNEMRSWAIKRMERLSAEGWRKAIAE